MFIKKVIICSGLLFAAISFCAEENIITSQKYPLLSRFIDFAKDFNAADLHGKIKGIIYFSNNPLHWGSLDYQKEKAQQIIILINELLTLEISEEDKSNLTSCLDKIRERYELNDLSEAIEGSNNDYFNPEAYN
ncbi:MAG: hypothetical protein P4L22_06825 [Candidatus Babeliales bacterium]|nr:hypothetical protein [Candidatus Babeliales bacterium]